jgi:hypothetical protein
MSPSIAEYLIGGIRGLGGIGSMSSPSFAVLRISATKKVAYARKYSREKRRSIYADLLEWTQWAKFKPRAAQACLILSHQAESWAEVPA